MDSYGVPVSAPLQYDNADSYGVPVSEPLAQPDPPVQTFPEFPTFPVAPVAYDYPDYVQYYDPDLVVPDYSALTEAQPPVYPPATDPPDYGYEFMDIFPVDHVLIFVGF